MKRNTINIQINNDNILFYINNEYKREPMLSLSNYKITNKQEFIEQLKSILDKFVSVMVWITIICDILIQSLAKAARESGKKYNIPLIVDAAQAAGIIDIDIERDNISCLCMPGHKGLYGPSGTGVLILSESCKVNFLTVCL